MATIKEDYEIITNLIKQEIDKRKKQKQSKENLKNIEEDISLLNKTEKKMKKKSKTSSQLTTISPNKKCCTKIYDYNDKYLNKDKTEASNLIKDELTNCISVANVSECVNELMLGKSPYKSM
ncbi:uncharacterized protein LOC132930483 [Rhopalosiphum padi]|uniref:uncharacterized protein LOC132930483 n=1 Tax=Rhopalosiphum padi TaxID=40932 RepID=UPI00298DBC80|nr:uncharacterized protein LOC132930483 [Rhopalosiphum padi]